VVSNPAPYLSTHTGRAPEYKACWEEPPTAEEVVQVERLLKEIAGLTARKLTQPIQERVHPAYEYWGREDPTRGQKCKVSRVEAANRVSRIMAGQIWDKGFPKALCLKRPTNAVSFLESSKFFSSFSSCLLYFFFVFPTAPVGL